MNPNSCRILLCTLFASVLITTSVANSASLDLSSSVERIQPVHEYSYSFTATNPNDPDHSILAFFTHLGTDYGTMGPGEANMQWKNGRVYVDLAESEWAGMWHSLAGRASEKDVTFNFDQCFPGFIKQRFQPRCTAIEVLAGGAGKLKLEISSPENRILWEHVIDVANDDVVAFKLPVPTNALSESKSLKWVAESGSKLYVDGVRLVLDFPKLSVPERLFLISYAKLARCYSADKGVVKDRANYPAGKFDCVPATGMFCLATSVASKLGIVDSDFANSTVRKVHKTISSLPTAHGFLPHFVTNSGNGFQICNGTEYSSIDTSIYYHAMLIAAEILGDHDLVKKIAKAIRSIEIESLRNDDGFICHGFQDDGSTALQSYWNDWGGETALVLLLERMASGERAEPKMRSDARVFNGVGFIAEIQSLFYPQFNSLNPDAITGANWQAVRRELLSKQMSYFPQSAPESAAAQVGVFGLSAGEAYRGKGYVANGVKIPNITLIHPHYMLMSSTLWPDSTRFFRVVEQMESRGLIPPWGLVENTTADLKEYLPMIGSLNASFETIAAYHLWAHTTGKTDEIYKAATESPYFKYAIGIFYP